MEKTKKRITAQGLEKISEAMLTAFLGCDFGMLQAVDMEKMAIEYFGLSVQYEVLSATGNLQALSVFRTMNLYFPATKSLQVHTISAGTILVDSSLRSPAFRGRRNLAIAKECARQLLFWKEPDAKKQAAQLFSAQEAYSPQQLRISCGVCEWEVNTLSSALLMPKSVINTLLNVFYGNTPVCVYGRGQLSAADRHLLDTFAAILGVTRSALILRLWQLQRIAVLPGNALQNYACTDDPQKAIS